MVRTSGNTNKTNEHIYSVTMLRGIASLAVCLMHLTGTTQSDLLIGIGRYGGWGVSIFFVISGFILPYSMYQAGYVIGKYKYFAAKRIIRLDPPYLASIIGIVLLSYIAQLSPFSSSELIDVFSMNTLYHLLYLVDIMDGKWLNPVFWTLAIEFQYYLVIALIFPLLINKNSIVKILVLSFLMLLAFLIPGDAFLPHYLPLFIPGIILFYYKTGQIKARVFIILECVAILVGFIRFGYQGPITGVLSVLFILYVSKPLKPLVFLGTISYSLYLIHTPFGSDGLINFAHNFIESTNGRILVMVAALPLIIFAAWVFYMLIEKPSMKFSKRISYKKEEVQ